MVIQVIMVVFITCTLACNVYPFIYLFSASVSNPDTLLNGQMWLFPTAFELDGYIETFQFNLLWSGYYNSFIYTFMGAGIQIAIVLSTGFALSCKDMPGKFYIILYCLIPGWIGSSGMDLPMYLLYTKLGLIDTRFGLIIFGLVDFGSILTCRIVFKSSCPWELHEQAKLDGCSHLRLFLQVAIPMSTSLVVIQVFQRITSCWGSAWNSTLYMSDKWKWPLPAVVADLQQKGLMYEEMLSGLTPMPPGMSFRQVKKEVEKWQRIRYCVVICQALPMIIITPFMQKYMKRGVMIGSLRD